MAEKKLVDVEEDRGSDEKHRRHNDEQAVQKQSAVEKERRHFRKVTLTFKNYAQWALMANIRRRRDLSTLSEHHQKLIPFEQIHSRLDAVDEAIRQNQHFFNMVVTGAEDMFPDAEGAPEENNQEVRSVDFDKLRSTLRQFVRDWSAEGEDERASTYTPILNELLNFYRAVPENDRGNVRVLVPGAGLGRLAFDIAKLGFTSQGNEFSFYMLLSSYFILNRRAEIEEFVLHPWVHSHSNMTSSDHQLQKIAIPDIRCDLLPTGSDFSMIAGDFVEVYGAEDGREPWDAIVTCFFIDTACNIAHYLEVIYKLLKPGGVWINLGPLLYHFEDVAGEVSIELTLEEVLQTVRTVGFTLEKQNFVRCSYASDKRSMLTYEYNSALWVAVKK